MSRVERRIEQEYGREVNPLSVTGYVEAPLAYDAVWALALALNSTQARYMYTVLMAFGGVKPKFHYADFHRNFPAGKVVDTNHESRGHKPSRHVEMFATKSVTSPRQTRLCRCNGI